MGDSSYFAQALKTGALQLHWRWRPMRLLELRLSVLHGFLEGCLNARAIYVYVITETPLSVTTGIACEAGHGKVRLSLSCTPLPHDNSRPSSLPWDSRLLVMASCLCTPLFDPEIKEDVVGSAV